MHNTIIGLFEDGTKAGHAITELLNSGIPREAIRAISNAPREQEGGTESADKAVLSGINGFLADIEVLSDVETHGVPKEHRNIYREGVSGGKTLLMVVTDQERSPRVVEVMERHGALNIDDGSPDMAQAATTLSQPVQQEPQYRASFEAYQGGVRVFPRSGRQNVSPSSQQRFTSTGPKPQQDQQSAQPQQAQHPVQGQEAYSSASQSQPTVQAVENQPGPVTDQARRIVEARQPQSPFAISFESYEPDFRANYQSMLSGTGYPWDYYAPAYRYGFDLGLAPGWPSNWAQVEPYARDQWERHNPSTWDRFKDAVRYSWQCARTAVRATTAPSAQPTGARDSIPGR